MFKLQRHLRLAGCVGIWAGLFLHNFYLIVFANLAVITGYMWSIATIERTLEEKEKTNAVHSERE